MAINKEKKRKANLDLPGLRVALLLNIPEKTSHLVI
jgi:hypothetical protein